MNRTELLTFEEIGRVVRVFASLGITKVRLTGGEPLMRKDLHVLVGMLARVSGINDLALTTNGYFLAEQASLLHKAGLRRINISLDSLNPVTFNTMIRRDHFDRVWEGIETVERLGIQLVKINVVLIRGINDNEIVDFASMTRTRPFVVRFIEFMPIGADDGWSNDKVVPTREVIKQIEEGIGRTLVPIEYHGAQAADRYTFDDGVGEIGFVSSVSEPFCDHCDRIRITSDGKLRTCLFSLAETDLRSLLRGGANDDEVREAIAAAVINKEEGHLINRPGFVRPQRTMSQIGG